MLIIVDDREDSVANLVPEDQRIRYLRLPAKAVLGEKRNRAATEARGEIIVHWDDSEWVKPLKSLKRAKSLRDFETALHGLG